MEVGLRKGMNVTSGEWNIRFWTTSTFPLDACSSSCDLVRSSSTLTLTLMNLQTTLEDSSTANLTTSRLCWITHDVPKDPTALTTPLALSPHHGSVRQPDPKMPK